MKRLLLVILISCVGSVFAGGFRFPNIPYSYAKVYLMNTNWDEKEMPDQSIYHDGIYAASKVGDGVQLSDEALNELEKIFARGVDEVRMGLSNCFIPRHGIVFFDAKHFPVASLSICFECEKVAFWSSSPLPKSHKPVDQFDIEYAEGQMAKLENLFVTQKIFVGDKQKEYYNEVSSDKSLKCEGSLEMTGPIYDSLFYGFHRFDDVQKWQVAARRSPLKEDMNIEITAGGDEYKFLELVGDDGTQLLFSSDDKETAHMMDGYITDPSIVLPWGISVGMSLDQVKSSVGLWDGIENPATLTLKGDWVKIDYEFMNRSLVSVRIHYDMF